MINSKTPLRLRPSVSVVPTNDPLIWEFFKSNTRVIRRVKFSDIRLVDIISQLNNQSALEVEAMYKDLSKYIMPLFSALVEWCILEDSTCAVLIENNKRYRALNFLADYIPSHELIETFSNIEKSTVILVGAGGVGSWIAIGLAQIGVKTIVLVDGDIVKEHNLNRGLFFFEDLGKLKTSVIKEKIKCFQENISVIEINKIIKSELDFKEILKKFGNTSLVINAADHPSVDTTSKWIFKPCMENLIPHIVAGGYNLHLSLIGPTIIPNISACFECISVGLKEQQIEDFSTIRKLHRSNRNIGNISPLAGISASFTINEALRVLCKSKRITPVMLNKRGEFNFLTSQLHFSEYNRQGFCEWCNYDK